MSGKQKAKEGQAGHKQKILIVHNYYQIPGGEDTVVANEKKLLEDYGHEVVLYTRHNNDLKSMSKLQKLGLPFSTVFNPRTHRDIKKIIREQKIEIVHVHNTLNLISLAVYYAAVKCKVPVVQTIHNFRFLCPGATFYRDGHICEDCISKGLGCAVKHKCYRGSRAQTLICAINTWIHRHTGILGKINFICLTEFNKEKLLQLKYINPDKVFVKPNFTFEQPKGREEVARNFYLFVGRIEEIKGVRVLLEAFSLMPDKQLKLAGDGPLMNEMRSICQKKGSTNIEFLGRVDHEALLKKMGEARAIILPCQWYEGFPMTIPEAFSVGTPMIVGDIGNASALVDEGITGMKFKFDSHESLIKVIQEFGKVDKQVYEINTREKYKNDFSMDINYKILSMIYNKICNKIEPF